MRDRLNESGAKLSDAETRFWAELTEAYDDGSPPDIADLDMDPALAAELAEIYAANAANPVPKR